MYKIKNRFEIKGTGLHTGKKTGIIIKPSEKDGIIFIKEGVKIEALLENVIDTERGVTLGKNNQSIKTTEHLLSALSGLNIYNAEIEVSGDEIPALDGSSKIFSKIISKNAIAEKDKDTDFARCNKQISINKNNKFITYIPDESFRITFILNYTHPLLKNQSLTLEINPESYLKQIAPARTYGFYSEIKKLYKSKLALGGSLKNAVVLTEKKYLNKRLRFKDECVRHKILDLIGDLSLVGRPIKGHIIGFASGHSLNIEFAKLLHKPTGPE